MASSVASTSTATHRGGAPSRRGRFLGEQDDEWTHNAWDDVKWDDEQLQQAQEAIERQKLTPVSEEQAVAFNADPASYWDQLYAKVTDTMYQDKSWLTKDFPELAETLNPDAGPRNVIEIGSGPGASLFPLYRLNQNPSLQLTAVDYSHVAVDLVRSNPAYDPKHMQAETWDVSDPNGLPEYIQPGSMDVVILVYIFSALHPKQWEAAIANIARMLKPDGVVCFRDFGRFDLCQLRFKKDRWMEDNLYVRGDGTRVHFFDIEEVRDMFCKAGLFDEIDLSWDQRLILNRKRQLKMYRRWLHGRFRSKASPM